MAIEPERSGSVLADLLMRGLGCLMPTEYRHTVSAARHRALKRQNRSLDVISQVLCLLGIFGGMGLPLAIRGRPVQFTGWDFGFMIGLSVALPTLFIVVATRLRGGNSFHDFLVFYSLKYGIDARKLFLFCYAPLIVLGLVSAYNAYFSDHA